MRVGLNRRSTLSNRPTSHLFNRAKAVPYHRSQQPYEIPLEIRRRELREVARPLCSGPKHARMGHDRPLCSGPNMANMGHDSAGGNSRWFPEWSCLHAPHRQSRIRARQVVRRRSRHSAAAHRLPLPSPAFRPISSPHPLARSTMHVSHQGAFVSYGGVHQMGIERLFRNKTPEGASEIAENCFHRRRPLPPVAEPGRGSVAVGCRLSRRRQTAGGRAESRP